MDINRPLAFQKKAYPTRNPNSTSKPPAKLQTFWRHDPEKIPNTQIQVQVTGQYPKEMQGALNKLGSRLAQLEPPLRSITINTAPDRGRKGLRGFFDKLVNTVKPSPKQSGMTLYFEQAGDQNMGRAITIPADTKHSSWKRLAVTGLNQARHYVQQLNGAKHIGQALNQSPEVILDGEKGQAFRELDNAYSPDLSKQASSKGFLQQAAIEASTSQDGKATKMVSPKHDTLSFSTDNIPPEGVDRADWLVSKVLNPTPSERAAWEALAEQNPDPVKRSALRKMHNPLNRAS